MLRPILLAVMSFALIVCAPVAAQDRNPPANGGAGARGKAAARQGAAKPAADEEPATQPAEDAEEPAPPARSDLRRSRLSSDVDRSIRKAVKFLVSRQNADGSWSAQGERDDLDVGTTALVTLALLSAGESHQSPALVKAVKYLKAARPEKVSRAVYSVGLRAAVYAQLPSAAAGNELKRDLTWLQRAMIDAGDMRGMYGYGFSDGKAHWGDYSNSQYGVLGVWYGAMAGVEVPLGYWKNVEHGWRIGQNEDGGWSYRPNMRRSYASMTAAGAATLFITNDYLHATEAENLTRPPTNKPLEQAIAWLGENFAVDHNPGIDTNLSEQRDKDLEEQMLDQLLPVLKPNTTWLHYMLFSYERVGEASGLTRFGRRKWFDEGASYLVKTQSYDGSWEADIAEEVDAAYALLFLARGRSPVVVQKLECDGRWNNRSRDVAAFVQFMRRATERHVNWQIVSIDSTPGELREAPILYIASDRPVKFTAEQRERLKKYVEQGGLILAVNEGKEDAFARSFASLAADMFPDFKFRDLPADHPIHTANSPSTWTEPVRGMSNGVRELIVLMPTGDASWKWQAAGGAFDVKLAPYAPLANLLLHLTDKSNPRYKGEDTWVERNSGVTTTRTARVARIKYNGNWDPEPGGWVRLSNVTHNFDQTQLQIGAFAPEQIPQQANFAPVTSTDDLQLSGPQLTGLRKYVDGGGVLVLDACGGNPETAVAFESLLRAMYPDVQIAPLPLDHPIYRAQNIGGQDIEEVSYRRSLDRPQTKLPRLKQATTAAGKLVAIVSNEDLSAGLVAYQASGPIGYTPQSATDLMRNIVLWSISRTPGTNAAR